jgi:formate dehydrogenase alpha subunit
MLQLTVNDRVIEAVEGETILSAVRREGIDVPTLCAVEGLDPAGACRICVVDVEGFPNLVPSCSFPVAAGMKIRTHSPRAVAARRTIVELLLANHPDDCLYCAKSTDCELRRLAENLGVRKRRFVNSSRAQRPDTSSPGIVRDPAKCILCGRCVATCGSIAVNEVLDFSGRGARARIVCDADSPMGLSSCALCGACVEACPVGALLFKGQAACAPEGRMETTRVTCPYCGVGCQIDLHHKEGRFVYSTAVAERAAEQPNQGMLCLKGRFGLDFLNHPERLKAPLLRKDGELVEVSWDEALAFAADGLAGIKAAHGADAIGFLSSAKCTNEENYALMRLARGAIGTNNIDHCARL